MKPQNLETRTNRAFNEVEKVRDKLTSVYVITKNGEKKDLSLTAGQHTHTGMSLM